MNEHMVLEFGQSLQTQPVRGEKKKVLKILPFFKLVKEIIHKDLYVRHDYHQSSPLRLKKLHNLSQFSILEKCKIKAKETWI